MISVFRFIQCETKKEWTVCTRTVTEVVNHLFYRRDTTLIRQQQCNFIFYCLCSTVLRLTNCWRITSMSVEDARKSMQTQIFNVLCHLNHSVNKKIIMETCTHNRTYSIQTCILPLRRNALYRRVISVRIKKCKEQTRSYNDFIPFMYGAYSKNIKYFVTNKFTWMHTFFLASFYIDIKRKENLKKINNVYGHR